MIDQGRAAQIGEGDVALTVEVTELRGRGAIRGHARVSQREDVDRVAVNAVALNVLDVHVVERHIRGGVEVDAVTCGGAVSADHILDCAAAVVARYRPDRAGYRQASGVACGI